MFDFLVIGKGLMGTAVAKYLSEESTNVAVLGPDEPTDWAKHEGVFASHYDQGRITRQLSKDIIWSTLAQRAIRQYAEIEARSGIRFYFPVGGLYVGPTAEHDQYLAQVGAIGQQLGVNYEPFASRPEQFSFLEFPDEFGGIYEPAPAGYINPRDLIRAQLAIFAANGGVVVRETAVSVTPHPNYVNIKTLEGSEFQAKKVVIAAGAFTNDYDLLPQKLPLRVKTETIILAEIPQSEVDRLAKMPTVIYKIDSPQLEDIYLLPPILYPDGRFYLKMGCNTSDDQTLADLTQKRNWLIHGSSDTMLEPMRAALQAIIPNLKATSWQTKRCVITYTTKGYPAIDELVAGHVYVATAGNGSSAKSSDTIGRLAASLALHGEWQDNLPHDHFSIVSW